MPDRNTVGDVPLEWYKDEEHIGYDTAGKKLKKKERRDQLDSFLARTDDANDWRKIYDEYNDEEVELTKEEVDMIRRIRQGKIPHAEVNPYEPYVDWFDYEDKGHPLSSAPEPKRRFIPSKWEAKKVVKLVRALRKGWIKLEKPKEKPRYYLMWGDDLRTNDKTANGLAYIPAPKSKLPGHEESYNPPVEYIPTQEEINSYKLMYEEDRPKFIPRSFGSLRQVPAYADFIKESFERCLDLYLCPRTRKKRINIDIETLIPKLPKPKDLQPYPTTCFMEYRGHTAAVSTLTTDSSGQWLASGSHDGTVRLWDVASGRCCRVWDVGASVRCLEWNPNPQLNILAVAVYAYWTSLLLGCYYLFGTDHNLA
jgi:ribosome biogenesis protein ERB1